MEAIKWISLAVGAIMLIANFFGEQPLPIWRFVAALAAFGLAMAISLYSLWKSKNTPAATQDDAMARIIRQEEQKRQPKTDDTKK